MNLPNKLTVLRLILVPVFFIVLTQQFSASPEHKAIDVPGVMNGVPAVAGDVA